MKKITKKLLSVLCAVLILAASVGTLAACDNGTSSTKYKLSDYFTLQQNGYGEREYDERDITEAEKPDGKAGIYGDLKCKKAVKITKISFTAAVSLDDDTPTEYVFDKQHDGTICKEYKADEYVSLPLHKNYVDVCNLKIEFEPL